MLFQIFIYLLAAVIAVPLAKRFGFGSVLGYLLAGVLIGPYALGLVGRGESGENNVMHVAEFGIIMMLFLIGLELKPALLWKLRTSILGLGGAQVVGTIALVFALSLVFGLHWKSAIALGCILAMSSTAIVLQSLQERGWLKNGGGQSCFSVLLFQDIAVIPILALMPLLALSNFHPNEDAAAHIVGETAKGISSLLAWQQALVILAAVALVIVVGRFLSRPIFRFIASTGMREVFTAFALLLVIGITLLMETVGLSPALGAFLAGVVLADNEYRHELESDIAPFKGILLGLFFISVGSGIDFPFIMLHPLWVLSGVLGIMVLKFGVLFSLSSVFKHPVRDKWVFALAMAQVGEFAFVLLTLAKSHNVLSDELWRLSVAVVALSMVLTPPIFLLLDRLVLRFNAAPSTEPVREMDEIEGHGKVIIAGFGRVGNLIGRLLRSNGVQTTVLDLNPKLVDNVRKIGLKAHYGDATRLDLLHSAGAAEAKVFVLAIDDAEKTMEIAECVRKNFPHLKILLRAAGRSDSYKLIHAGFDSVYRETVGTALDMGKDTLVALGFRSFKAHRAVQTFKRHNETAFHDLAHQFFEKGEDKGDYVRLLRAKIEEADELLSENGVLPEVLDKAWDNDSLRDEANRGEL